MDSSQKDSVDCNDKSTKNLVLGPENDKDWLNITLRNVYQRDSLLSLIGVAAYPMKVCTLSRSKENQKSPIRNYQL